ncbi:MAG TPA: XrtA-associated tyrosine autokinase [Casimicrobiaceae bacterium]|jgi:receptor protein-tyrosine kinase
MSLIEQAAKRLEELRRAGAETAVAAPGAAEPAPLHVAEHLPTPEAAMRGLAGRVVAQPPVTPSREQAPRARDIRRSDGHEQRQIEIDLDRLKTRGFVTPDAPKSQIADEFRVIKRPVIHNARRTGETAIRNGNLIMVTSALPGEGKTFTAVNLALSVAMELDTTVLLVDGDVAHPELPRVLGTPGSPGLLELLTTDDLDVSDAILRTNVENLSVLPAGAHHRRATELLASEQMAIVLHELAMRYPDRIVIFDSPPLLPTTEARALALHMGQIVMVVAADSTRQHAVNLALATIENCPIVLMMLNKADKTDVGTYYGYYADEEQK